MAHPTAAGKRRLMIFSHPNHEIGMYGFAQKVRPHFVFLTDGNNQRRFGESRAGLEALGLEGQATYLKVREGSIYEAFLERDTAFFRDIAARVREVVEEVRPEQVFCDAVEFYSPSRGRVALCHATGDTEPTQRGDRNPPDARGDREEARST